MKKRALFAVLAVAISLMFSCGSAHEESKPTGLLSEEKMAEVLTDVRLLEGAYAGDFQRVDTSEYAIGAYYEQLFIKHGIARDEFLESNEYYALHQEELMRIETQVVRMLDSLSASTPR
jgi:hypothetical protein